MTEIRKIHDGVADLSTNYKLLNRHSERPYQERTEALFAGEWWEVDEETYWTFLEMMPPMIMSGGGFAMCEATIGDVYSCYYKIDDRYFHCAVPLTDRGAFSEARNQIADAVASEPVPAPR